MNQTYFNQEDLSSSQSSQEEPDQINFLSGEGVGMPQHLNPDNGFEELNINTFQPTQVEKKSNGSHETIKIKFGHNVSEGLKQVRETLNKEQDVKSVTIVFWDQKKQKFVKIRVRNEKNQAPEVLANKMLKKRICKTSKPKTPPTPTVAHKHKNGPKLLGKAMVDYFFDEKNDAVIEKIIEENKRNHKDKKPNLQDMRKWIEDHHLGVIFNKIQTFSEVWSLADNEDIQAKVFRDVCHHFLINEGERFIISRFCGNSSKEMKLENALAYLSLLPKFVRGVLDPQNFCSLK